jgi:hypothetical protein
MQPSFHLTEYRQGRRSEETKSSAEKVISARPLIQRREQDELRTHQIQRCLAVANDEKFPFAGVQHRDRSLELMVRHHIGGIFDDPLCSIHLPERRIENRS